MRISDWSSDVCSSDLPSLDANGAVSRERLSAGRPIGPGVPVTADQYVLGTQLNYELDLWGRVRNEVTAGDADRAAGSEEHTSELQSLMRISYAVFCLKKKKTKKYNQKRQKEYSKN